MIARYHPALFMFLALATTLGSAAEIEVIGPGNRFPMQGKEVDWIDGDFVLRNDEIVAVIARPGPVRDANMTVRGVGACLIDLTRLDAESDQLSCFYPAAGRFEFHDASRVEHGQLDDGGVYWRCQSSAAVADRETVATVEYRLRDGDPFLSVNVQITGGDLSKLSASDGVRADRTFQFAAFKESPIAYCEDEHFLQTYGFRSVEGEATPKWGDQRLRQLIYEPEASGDSRDRIEWTTHVFPASSPLDLWGLSNQAPAQTFLVRGAVGDQPRIKLSLVDGDVGPLSLPASWRAAPSGRSIVHLPPGRYRLRAEAIGHALSEQVIEVTGEPGEHMITLGAASHVLARVTDESGNRIPCKATFYGINAASGEPTPNPSFGTESQSGSVGNCVYSADGTFTRSIPPGTYEILISRGPEYDVVYRKITVKPGEATEIDATLKRVVDTTGWISAELHSHSSPSGDNTSDQLGRVENLVCEHLEFAPCTEHQRIESYDDQLKVLDAIQFMATCSGMELTGSPLPINHQNAFPLELEPFQQDGGGPRTDPNPITQIARLAMWDDNSRKIVQTNHPNMRQMVHDKDLDGTPDGGFAKMLSYMDVIEVHPPQDIFMSAEQTASQTNPDSNKMTPWMELIKSGRWIPGVVNTDAHYNHHGSGWLRNWIRCSTDDPAKISTEEMIDRLEKGQVLMSNGPFMNVSLHHPELKTPAMIGDAVNVTDAAAELAIKIQCPNWLDVNRVEVFVNGERRSELSRTRADHPEAFGNGVVKFDQKLEVELPERSFIIVATIGERMDLTRVYGETYGKAPPVAVSNPIFVTVK